MRKTRTTPDYDKIARISKMLEPLGYELEGDLRYTHNFIDCTVDCSALNEDYIMREAGMALYQAGVKHGETYFKRKLREMFQEVED